LIVSTFFLVAYLIIMFQIVVDLFRDRELGGGSKVLWIIGLIFIPVLTAIVYVVARGRGMADRQQASMLHAKSEADSYIRGVAGRSPAADIAEANPTHWTFEAPRKWPYEEPDPASAWRHLTMAK
jgi:hypothetical protein